MSTEVKRAAEELPASEPPAKRQRFKPQESTAGISEYMNSEKRASFTARLKSRPFDFIVKEIDLAGKVVALTNFENPVKEDDSGTKGLDEGIKQQLNDLVENEEITAKVRIDVTKMDKSQRTVIHVSLRNGFPTLQSETKDEENSVKIIEVSKKAAHKGERLRYYWPNGRPNHTTFTLYKDNIDTMEAINSIAALTRVRPSTFSYAGTKDKRAVTTQKVSVYRMKPDYLLGINKRNENFKIGDVHFGEKQIQLGELKGNRFILTLRDVKGGTREELEKSLKDLKDGFINYFGLQRFGTTSVPTHDVGKKMLADQWAEACDLILMYKEGGRPRRDLDAARKLWMETKDAAKCHELLTTRGSQTSLEAHLLEALKKDPNNFQSALFGLQKNTRLLYIHAYQSYVWNKVVSRRVAKFGKKVLVGDLVMKSDSDKDAEKSVQVVTAENQSDFSIWDVVLPLPGYAMRYPDNEQAQWFRDVVVDDDFDDLSCFESRNRAFSMRGSYRKVYCLPADFSYEIKTYTDPDLPLVETDWAVMLKNDENLRKVEERKIQIKHERREKELAKKKENGEPIYERRELKKPIDDTTEKTAVILSFSLPSSAYATMLLREFLRDGQNDVKTEDPNALESEDEAVDV